MTRGTIITGLIILIPIFINSQYAGYSVTVQIPAEGREPTAVTELRATRGPCTCEDDLCSCCTGVLMQQFNQKGCVNLAYDPDDFAFNVKVSMNDRTVYKNSVSGKNPQPVCVPIPRLPALKLCVKFSNVYLAGRNIHACIDMEGHFYSQSMFKLAFDCVRMGANGVAILKPEDGGGIPDDYDVPDEGPDYDIEGEGGVEDEDQSLNTTKKGQAPNKVIISSSAIPISITPPTIKITTTPYIHVVRTTTITTTTTTAAPSVKVTATNPVTSQIKNPSTVAQVSTTSSKITAVDEVSTPTTQRTSFDINTQNSKLGNVVPL